MLLLGFCGLIHISEQLIFCHLNKNLDIQKQWGKKTDCHLQLRKENQNTLYTYYAESVSTAIQ